MDVDSQGLNGHDGRPRSLFSQSGLSKDDSCWQDFQIKIFINQELNLNQTKGYHDNTFALEHVMRSLSSII